MHFLATALPALALAAPALGGMLEARQAFPVNGTCQPGEGLAPTDTCVPVASCAMMEPLDPLTVKYRFGEDALNLLVEELYVRKNASAAFASFFSPGCTCPLSFCLSSSPPAPGAPSDVGLVRGRASTDRPPAPPRQAARPLHQRRREPGRQGVHTAVGRGQHHAPPQRPDRQ